MKKTSLVIGLLLTLTGAVRADLPAPSLLERLTLFKKPTAPKEVSYPLVIEAGQTSQEARLQIPRKMLGQLRAELDRPGDSGFAAVDRWHTIVAGVALAMALAFSGLWLVRRSPGSGRKHDAPGRRGRLPRHWRCRRGEIDLMEFYMGHAIEVWGQVVDDPDPWVAADDWAASARRQESSGRMRKLFTQKECRR